MLILDISDTSLKLIHLTTEEIGWREDVLEELLLSPKLSESGALSNPQAMAQIIKSTLRAQGIKIRKGIILLRKDLFTLDSLELPEVPPREIRKMVNWEIEKYVPYPKEEAIFDFEQKKTKEGRIEIQLVVAKRALIESLLSLLQFSGLKPIALKPALSEGLKENLKSGLNLRPKDSTPRLIIGSWVGVIIIIGFLSLGIGFRAGLIKRQVVTLDHQINVLRKISQHMPEGVWLKDLISDSSAKTVAMNGLAPNRLSIKNFIGKLSSKELFPKVSLESAKKGDGPLIEFKLIIDMNSSVHRRSELQSALKGRELKEIIKKSTYPELLTFLDELKKDEIMVEKIRILRDGSSLKTTLWIR